MANDRFADKSQFEFIYSALVNHFPGIKADGVETSFQFAQGPIQANWKNGNDITAYNTANSVSASLGGFYAPSPTPLTGAYQDLILSIKPSNYDDNATYQKYTIQLGNLRSKRDAMYQSISVAWQTYVEQNTGDDGKVPQTKGEWEKDPMGGGQYYDDVQDVLSEIKDLTSRISKLTKTMDAALSRAQDDLDSSAYANKYRQEDGSFIDLPKIELEGNLIDDISKWDKYADGEYDFQDEINRQTEIKNPWKTTYDVQFHQRCLTTSASANVNTARIIADERYKLEVCFKGFKSYKVSFGGWFHGSYVNPDTAKFPEGSTVNNDTFFGVNGSLHMLPSMIWVAYKPKIRLTTSTKLYKQQFEENANTSINWLDLFSFRFKFDSLASLKPVENGDNTTTVTFDAPVFATPQVFGVTSLVRFNGHSELVAA